MVWKTRLGSFAAGYEFFFEWLKVENEKENPDRKAIRENCTSLEYFIAGLCEPKILLDYIENFILYDRRRTKIIAKNHQFFGVNNAYNAFLRREELKGKRVCSGIPKAAARAILWLCLPERLSINVLAILPSLSLLTVKIWIRRFIRTSCVPNLLQIRTKVQPANSKQLREELKTNKSILFTLIHKFRYDKGKKYPVLSERDDIIVIVDEAHRTQYKDLAENMQHRLAERTVPGIYRDTSAWSKATDQCVVW